MPKKKYHKQFNNIYNLYLNTKSIPGNKLPLRCLNSRYYNLVQFLSETEEYVTLVVDLFKIEEIYGEYLETTQELTIKGRNYLFCNIVARPIKKEDFIELSSLDYSKSWWLRRV